MKVWGTNCLSFPKAHHGQVFFLFLNYRCIRKMYIILIGQKYIVLLICKRYLCFLHHWTVAAEEISIVDNTSNKYSPQNNYEYNQCFQSLVFHLCFQSSQSFIKSSSRTLPFPVKAPTLILSRYFEKAARHLLCILGRSASEPNWNTAFPGRIFWKDLVFQASTASAVLSVNLLQEGAELKENALLIPTIVQWAAAQHRNFAYCYLDCTDLETRSLCFLVL